MRKIATKCCVVSLKSDQCHRSRVPNPEARKDFWTSDPMSEKELAPFLRNHQRPQSIPAAPGAAIPALAENLGPSS